MALGTGVQQASVDKYVLSGTVGREAWGSDLRERRVAYLVNQDSGGSHPRYGIYFYQQHLQDQMQGQ